MKLYSGIASPFARKIRVLLHELGMTDKVEFIVQKPRENSNNFHSVNPLARIPALLLDDGMVLYDSPVIAEYFTVLAGNRLLAPSGAARWDALRRMALGDGLLDSGFPLRNELARKPEMQDPEIISRHRATVYRTLDALNVDPSIDASKPLDVGTISLACAINWLDFRLPDLAWQAARPRLAAWLAALNERPSFQTTRPS